MEIPLKAIVSQFFFYLRAFCSYFKVREIINAEKVVIGVEPIKTFIAVEKDLYCMQNYSDISLVIGSSQSQIQISALSLFSLLAIIRKDWEQHFQLSRCLH